MATSVKTANRDITLMTAKLAQNANRIVCTVQPTIIAKNVINHKDMQGMILQEIVSFVTRATILKTIFAHRVAIIVFHVQILQNVKHAKKGGTLMRTMTVVSVRIIVWIVRMKDSVWNVMKILI